jgi:hypothetical protein
MKKFLFHIILIGYVASAYAQDIVVQGSVSFDFEKHCNIRAGEEYKSYITSDDDAVNIDIKKLKKNSYWTIAVSKRDVDWDNRVKIFVCRSSNGNANYNNKRWVAGGTNFQRIQNIPSYFFRGYEKVSNIDIQYQLRGLSANLESKTYYTNIVYTLYED